LFMRRFVSALLLLSVFSSFSAHAQTKPKVQVPATSRPQAQALVQQLLREGKIMRSRDAKRGMTGYALSVFEGTKIEKFPIRIIGVLESVNGGGDFVLFRATGGTVVKRNSGIVSGMSGSPVYINGKLLGAIAIGFGFPREPIGGITPITEMIQSTLPDPTRARTVAPSGSTKPVRSARLETLTLRPREPLQVAGRNITRVVVSPDRKRMAFLGERRAATMTMHPATMQLQVSGISAAALPRLREKFLPYGLEPVQGGRSFGCRSWGRRRKRRVLIQRLCRVEPSARKWFQAMSI
jgi:hypothetical protein